MASGSVWVSIKYIFGTSENEKIAVILYTRVYTLYTGPA